MKNFSQPGSDGPRPESLIGAPGVTPDSVEAQAKRLEPGAFPVADNVAMQALPVKPKYISLMGFPTDNPNEAFEAYLSPRDNGVRPDRSGKRNQGPDTGFMN